MIRIGTGQLSSRRRYLEKYEWRIKNNICTRCGLEPPEQGKTRCKECNDKEKIRKNLRTKCKYFKQNGLIKTGQNVGSPSMSIYG